MITAYQMFLRQEKQAETWDYEHLRDLIHEHLLHNFIDSLYAKLQKETWFKPDLVSKEAVLERCIELYIAESLTA